MYRTLGRCMCGHPEQKSDGCEKKMRAIAEEPCALVKKYKARYSSSTRRLCVEWIGDHRFAPGRGLAEIKDLSIPRAS